MTQDNTLARSLHDLGLATWFGGSLMGAVGLNGAAAVVDQPAQRLRVANAGWARWTPVNLAGIAAHLAGGAVLLTGNKAAWRPSAGWPARPSPRRPSPASPWRPRPIHALAPTCQHCGCRIIGHDVEADSQVLLRPPRRAGRHPAGGRPHLSPHHWAGLASRPGPAAAPGANMQQAPRSREELLERRQGLSSVAALSQV